MYNFTLKKIHAGTHMSNKSKNFYLLSLLVLISIILIPGISFAQRVKADKAIVIEDYTWGASTMGGQATLRDITLKNTSLQEFENIDIEIELFTINSIPQGSLRGTIHDVLPAGATKTFEKIKFGLMHSDLQRSIARVVRADYIQTGTPDQPSDLILVTNWEWQGGQYGTEGILKEITLENRSDQNYKDIKIRINDLGVRGSAKVGTEGYTSNVVIHDILPAKSSSTYTNVNVGFRHPDSTDSYIYVVDANELSNKELRYIIKKETKEGNYETAKKVEITLEDEPERRLSIAERYRQKLEETDVNFNTDVADSEINDAQGVEIPADTSDDAIGTSDEAVATRTEQTDFDQEDMLKNKPSDNLKPKEIELGYATDDDIALPKQDIVVTDFKWGSGVPGSQGVMKEIRLKNRSGITYSKIELLVEFVSSTGVPLASKNVKIIDVLPPHSSKTFEDIKLGLIVVLPNEKDMIITVKDAKSSVE